MDHEGQGGILLSLGDGEKLFPQGERRRVIPSRSVKCPQPIQDLRDLERLPHLQTQLLRAGVGLFHFGGTIPLRGHQRRAETQMEGEFLAGSGGGVRQGLEQFKSCGEVGDGFRVRRLPRRLLSRQAEILHGLCGIATATIMMREVAVVVVQSGLCSASIARAVCSCRTLRRSCSTVP